VKYVKNRSGFGEVTTRVYGGSFFDSQCIVYLSVVFCVTDHCLFASTEISTRTYISGTDIYPHMPILRPHAERFHERRISKVTFMSAHLYGNVYMPVGMARALADSFDFGLLGEKSSTKWEIPCFRRR